MENAASPSSSIDPGPAVYRPDRTDTVRMEHHLLKVPFESLKKSMRAGARQFEKAVSSIASDISKESDPHLNAFVDRLRGLKRKLSEISDYEDADIKRCRTRLDYLRGFNDTDKEAEARWRKTNFDRILVDYMSRSGYLETASKLMEMSPLQDLTDVNLYAEAYKVVEALKARDVTKVLAWCSENKGKLRKRQSPLEFKVRLQEFLELVRAGKKMKAVEYARKHLAAPASAHLQHMQEFQQVLVTLLGCRKELLADSRWDSLIQLFKEEFYSLAGMPSASLFHLHFQAGLAVLNTQACYLQRCVPDDPMFHEAFCKLAAPMPVAPRSRSTLECFISKEAMDDDNPPLVLPNGYVYGTKALEDMANKNQGLVTCPRTGESFYLSQTTRAFIT